MKRTACFLILIIAAMFGSHLMAAENNSDGVWGKLIPELLDRVGFPVATVLAIIYGITKVVKWAAPKIDALIDANKKRQEVMADEYKKTTTLFATLASETKTMQATNVETLKAMERALQQVCQYRCAASTVCNKCGAKIVPAHGKPHSE